MAHCIAVHPTLLLLRAHPSPFPPCLLSNPTPPPLLSFSIQSYSPPPHAHSTLSLTIPTALCPVFLFQGVHGFKATNRTWIL